MIDLNNDELVKRINEINNPLNWVMESDDELKLEDLPAIIPLIEIQDNGCKKPHTFVFGNNIHDRLIIETKNNHSYLIYENLQNGCGSKYCDEGYEFLNNGNPHQLDYIESNVKCVNLAKLIDNYNKENNMYELKKENKELREKGFDYALQLEISYKALELACDMIKDIKFKTNNGYNGDADFYNYFIEKAKEQLKDEKN